MNQSLKKEEKINKIPVDIVDATYPPIIGQWCKDPRLAKAPRKAFS